ncbi:Early nodulin-like protein 13 [Cardamine amara subsp. amara]|uniref:Early nodulin-like protein 13 n=1 Tax=Cardamine amara subsp. amara TaxID=228776 RepID=A0ABD1B0U4_CARAN
MARRTLVEASFTFFFFFFFLVDLACCKEILVGGKPSAWKIPSSPSDSLNKWAESLRFHVGDSLVWKYDGEKDSVLQVTKEAYINCNTTNPAANYSNGDTKVKLERSGPFFFISGSKSNCIEGEKLHIVVMSSRGGHTGGFFSGSAPSPAPSTAILGATAVAPATGGSASLTCRVGVLGFLGLLGIVLL